MKEVKNLCMYHSTDYDGKLAAAIWLTKFPKSKLVEINKDDISPPWDLIEEYSNETISLINFTFDDIDIMLDINIKCQNFIHINKKPVIRENNEVHSLIKSTCELTWAFLYGDIHKPEVVYYISQYDKEKLVDENIIPFNLGLYIRDTTPKSKIWLNLLPIQNNTPEEITMIIRNILADGQVIQKYLKISQNT